MNPHTWIPNTKENPAVDTRRRAAIRTRNAGSSLANWALVSWKVFKFAFPGKFLQTNRNVRDLPLWPFDKLAYLQLIFFVHYGRLIFLIFFGNIFSLIFLQLIFCQSYFLIFFTNICLANQADLFFCQFCKLIFCQLCELIFGRNILFLSFLEKH